MIHTDTEYMHELNKYSRQTNKNDDYAFLLVNKLCGPGTNLVALGGSTGTVSTSLLVPMAPTDLLYLPLGLGEGGWGSPKEKVALLLAGRTESLRGFTGGGGGWGRDTLGLLFFRLSSIF